MLFAEHEFRLSRPDESGVPLRAHLEQVARTTGETPEELRNPAELPLELEHVWGWFLELNASRVPGFSGISPVTYQDIRAWRDLTGHLITPAEVTLIRRLDRAFCEAMAPKKKK